MARNTSATKQKQKISWSKKNPKTEEGRRWWEQNADYYLNKTTNYSLQRNEFLDLYRLANGEMDELEYTHVTNPYNETREELLGFPAKMRNYDIVSPLVMLLMGEKGKRPNSRTVVARNSDTANIRKEAEAKKWMENLQQMFINELNKQMAQEGGSGVQDQVLKGREQITQEAQNLPDAKAKMGQDGLDYIYDFNEIPRKFRKGFYDWIVTARVFSFKGIRDKDTEYEIVSPYNFNYLTSQDQEFVEDGEAAWREAYMTLAEIVDKFKLDEKVIDELEDKYMRYEGSADQGNTYMSQTEIFYRSIFRVDTNKTNKHSGIKVEHVCWRSFEKRGQVTATNVLGEEFQFFVDEDYISAPGETVEWRWVSIPYEIYRIDEKHYVEMNRVAIKGGSFEHPGKGRLLYNGRTFGARHVDPISTARKLLAYQIRYNILHYQLEMTMAKNGDKIIVMPQGLIPDKEGFDMYKMMYYSKATSFLFVDETKKNAQLALSSIKVLDLGLSNYINSIDGFLQQVKREAEEVIGISRQRKGQTTASDQVGTTQEAVFRSTVMTEEMFMQFEEWERREDQGLMDLSKYAWSGGKKETYVNSQGKIAYLDLNPEDYAEVEFAVFAVNAGKDLEKLEALRNSAHAFAQNAASPSTVAKIIDSDNFKEIMRELAELESKIQQSTQAAQETEVADKQRTEELELLKHEGELDFKYYKTDQDNETKIEEALIKNEGVVLGQGGGEEATGSPEQLQKIVADTINRREELQIRKAEMKSKEKIARSKDETALKIAKENKTAPEIKAKASSNGQGK